MPCRCGPEWRVETFDLVSGQVNGLLDPVSMELQWLLNEPASGSFTCLTRETTMRQVWPGLQGVGVLYGGRPQWAGYVDAVRAGADGTFDVGCTTLDGYWHRRVLTTDQTFTAEQHTVIGAALANLAVPGGITLDAQAEPSSRLRDRTYLAADRPLLGELINNLTLVRRGFDYELLPQRAAGVWSATAAFRDYVGLRWRAPVRARLVADDYGVDVDGAQLGNRVTAIAGDPPVVAVAQDTTGGYPVWDQVVKLDGDLTAAVLAEHAEGYVDANRLPFATPTVRVPGDTLEHVAPGDVLERVLIDHGVGLCFDGAARVLGVTVQAAADGPSSRELILTPTVQSEDALLDDQCAAGCTDC